MEYQGQHYQEI